MEMLPRKRSESRDAEIAWQMTQQETLQRQVSESDIKDAITKDRLARVMSSRIQGLASTSGQGILHYSLTLTRALSSLVVDECLFGMGRVVITAVCSSHKRDQWVSE